MVSVAIVDVIGLTYDGETLQKRGLGGSESAVILVSRELQRLGFDVTVFNNCIDSQAKEGVYEGVKFVDIQRLAEPNNYTADIVIASRTVVPFAPMASLGQYDCTRYHKLAASAKLKVLWMHDTFCWGDEFIEDFILAGHINEIFTLSDFHTTYVTNCWHGGKRRNFEVLKNKVFMTRNGMTKYIDEVDIKAKDKDLFVYNASVTKGLVPLLTRIWPEVKKFIPTAKLKVIGGFYRFRDNAAPDAQEKTLREFAADPKYAQLDVEFTGVIKQLEIAEILAKSSFMIYPAAFPETFGISSLESLYYNTPLLTCRFGALEETAVSQACYMIDYAIEPNNLFPHINIDEQVQKFIEMTLRAYVNPYLHQQKMYACNIIKELAGWDSVALQWKQHFYKRLGGFLPVEEYRKVSRVNAAVHQIFGRRFSNYEETSTPPHDKQQHIVLVSTMYNAEAYVANCIQSVAQQNYGNYTQYIIDDASTDNSASVAQTTIDRLPEELRNKFVLIRRTTNVGAVKNQIDIMRTLEDDDVVVILDGDDWLVNDPDIFHYYNNIYHDGYEFSYGSCWSLVDNIPLISQPYPKTVRDAKAYRNYHFNWVMPYTHLRTFRKRLLNKVPDSAFKDSDGNWFKAGGDGSVFYSVIEQADPNKIKVVSRIVYNYNDTNPLNDYKVNGTEQTKNAKAIVKMNNPPAIPNQQLVLSELGLTPKAISAPAVINSMPTQSSAFKKKILLAIPTAKYIEVETFKSIYDLDVPDGYEVEFRYSFGYRIDQVRNLIASWAVDFDYVMWVDSDIILPRDTLTKMLSHDKDIVSGMYIQRIPGTHNLEIYKDSGQGGVVRTSLEELPQNSLVEIASCGFGCVLVKSKVMNDVGHPQFVYHVALDHRHTVSEDVDFCVKARAKGFKLFVDTSIKCAHTGASTYYVGQRTEQVPVIQPVVVPPITPANPQLELRNHLVKLANAPLLPKAHIDFLVSLRDQGVQPKVIYDIGSSVLHWSGNAKRIWPAAHFEAFEAQESLSFLYKEAGISHTIGLLSDVDNKEVTFYQNEMHPGGNSYYQENEVLSPAAASLYTPKTMIANTLDTVVTSKGLPLPDFVKMDVQGAEMDVLKGATNTLKNCKHLILELQQVEYNKGAPLRDTVIAYVESLGFKLVTPLFCDNGPDGDYYFRKD